jgi:hypothetical protein
VLWGACDALYTPRPLAPLHDVARQSRGPLLAALASEAGRDVVFNAALDELEREKSLVVFEDIHWADEATLDLLKFLGRRIQRTRTMLVVTYRDDELAAQAPLRFVIADLPRAHTRGIQLQPLSEDAVSQLARRAHRPPTGLHSITGGNPFFVTEILASKTETVPATVREAVLTRAARLSAPAREVAEHVCIVPGKAEISLLEQAAPLDRAGIEECLRLGILRQEGISLAFRHELARRVLEDSLTQSRRQELHAKVLATLVQWSDVSSARLAHHADGARNAELVLRSAPLAAAQAAAVGAHSSAVSHYRIALGYAARLPPEEKAQLLENLSYECYLTGQHHIGFEARRAAADIWRATGASLREGDAVRWLSRLSWFAGDAPRRVAMRARSSQRSRHCLPARSWRWHSATSRISTWNLMTPTLRLRGRSAPSSSRSRGDRKRSWFTR